jgi:uncharacterized protein
MYVENFRMLAALIYAHSEHTVEGRTRLQKTVRLLQRIGFPTDYTFSIYFYGPYSDGVASDVQSLKAIGYIEEKPVDFGSDVTRYEFRSCENELEDEIEPFRDKIKLLENYDLVVLELAATYDSYLQMTGSKEDALVRLRHKKGEKCTPENEERALALLNALGLQTE